jgi:polyadenylate-binding protein
MYTLRTLLGVISIIKTAEKARKELNGENFRTKAGISRPIRICKYEAKNKEADTNINKNLLIRNIEKSITAKEFFTLFQKFGEIKSAKLETNEHGESKGYGYVYFYKAEDAERAVEEMVRS